MLKINLEKELLLQNQKLVTPQELLFIKEYEKIGDDIKDDSLLRIGIASSAIKGNKIKEKIGTLKQQTEKFDQSRVFHISQIENICMKYYLRFLPSCLYKGAIDKELPYKINNFEAVYSVKCNSKYDGDPERCTGNTFIVAPSESFKLKPKELDPLLFYSINDEYFYLIHKWGADLSITRRIKSFFSTPKPAIIVALCIVLALAYLNYISIVPEDNFILTHVLIGVIQFLGFALFSLVALVIGIRIYPKNDYQSPYL